MSKRKLKRQTQRELNYCALHPRGGNTAYRMNFAEARWNMQKQMYIKQITALALSRFTWTGLPNSIDERFLELSLFEQGLALFFLDDRTAQFNATLCTMNGNINKYYNPTRFTPYGNGYTYRTLTASECVPIWDNLNRMTEFDIVEIYADRLTRIDQIIDENLENQKIPLIITCDDTQRLTIQNVFKQRQEGQPVIIGNSALGAGIAQGVQPFPVQTPYIVDKLQQAKQQTWNECLSFLGVRNSTTEKRERLITDESEANNERVNIFRENFLKARQQACDQINMMFPELTIGIDWAAGSEPADFEGENNERV